MLESLEYRNKRFLKSEPEDLTQKRNEFLVQLRKNKRYEKFKRFREETNKTLSETKTCSNFDSLANEDVLILADTECIINLQSLNSDTQFSSLLGTITEVKELVLNEKAALEYLLQSGFIQYLIPFTSPSTNPAIKYEIFQIFTSLSLISHKEVLKTTPSSILTTLLSYIEENSEEIVLKSLCVISKLLLASDHFFELLQIQGFFPKLLQTLKNFKVFEVVQTISTLCLNITDYEGLLTPYETLILLEIFQEIFMFEDIGVKNICVLALGNLIRADSNKIELLLEHEIFESVFECWESGELSESFTKMCANLTCGTSKQVQKLIDYGIFNVCLQLFRTNNRETLANIYFALSNIIAGTTDQLQQVLMHPVFDVAIESVLKLDESGRVEASFFVRNAIKLMDLDWKRKIFQSGVCQKVVVLMEVENPEGIINCLSVFEEFIKIYGRSLFESMGYDSVIEQLQRHKDPEVYRRCVFILEY